MGYGKVEICGVNTSKLKVLKNDEMMELLRRTREGDMEAREEMIAGNLRLVLSVIQRFSGRGENADDLFQVGCIGLIKAIDNFDPTQNVRFSTYGVPMICRNRKKLKTRSAGKAAPSGAAFLLQYIFQVKLFGLDQQAKQYMKPGIC